MIHGVLGRHRAVVRGEILGGKQKITISRGRFGGQIGVRPFADTISPHRVPVIACVISLVRWGLNIRTTPWSTSGTLPPWILCWAAQKSHPEAGARLGVWDTVWDPVAL